MKNAHELDQKAKGLAEDFLRTEGQLLELLSRMKSQRVFTELNYSGIFDYCERALKFSRAQSFYFKSVAEKSEEVPQIRQAIVQGELTLSQARRIVPVVTKENLTEWIKKANCLSQVELERAVTEINPKAQLPERIRPVAKELSELRVALDPTTQENLTALKEILSQKLKRAATLADVVAWASEVTREKFDPIRKAMRSRNKSSGNQNAVTPGRQPIQANVIHSINERDERRCTHQSLDGRRCEQERWLQIHHQIPVSQGGLNLVNNLKLLCEAHHRLEHKRA